MSDTRDTRRRWPFPVALVLALFVIGALAGAVSAVARGSSFTSETQLTWDPSVRSQVDPDYSSPDAGTFDRQVSDQRDVILSDAVMKRVIDDVGGRLELDAAGVRRMVTVQTTAGSSEILIAGTARTPRDAQAITSSVAQAYVGTLRDRNANLLKARINGLQPVIVELRRQLTAAATAAAAGAVAENIADLQSQQAAYTVAASQVPVEATVQRAAPTPTGPSSLNPFVAAVIGGVLGIVVAVSILLISGSTAGRGRLNRFGARLLPFRGSEGRAAPEVGRPAPERVGPAEEQAVAEDGPAAVPVRVE